MVQEYEQNLQGGKVRKPNKYKVWKMPMLQKMTLKLALGSPFRYGCLDFYISQQTYE